MTNMTKSTKQKSTVNMFNVFQIACSRHGSLKKERIHLKSPSVEYCLNLVLNALFKNGGFLNPSINHGAILQTLQFFSFQGKPEISVALDKAGIMFN